MNFDELKLPDTWGCMPMQNCASRLREEFLFCAGKRNNLPHRRGVKGCWWNMSPEMSSRRR
jgi:hypothetical protein